LKTAVWAIIELDVLMSPNLFESLDCLAARLGITLFQLVDRSLGETNSSRKLALTPTEHGTSRPDFGCESALSAFINLAVSVTCTRFHIARVKQKPPAVSRRGL
jgi:hypothetical protein